MTDSTKVSLGQLTTEARNPLTQDLDNLSALEIVKVMNAEDKKLAAAVRKVSEPIAKAIDVIADRLSRGGRLIYVGAGTSGRLGVLDAVECPPTFNTDPAMVIGLIAGGPKGLLQAVEGAEDSREMGCRDLQLLELSGLDVVVGIAASGRTPYVIGALDYARETGAIAIAFSCNQDAEIAGHADLSIIPLVGPEVLSGSTRLKAGTATKMVLNMLTTGAMVRMGKTYSNLMVDLRATNTKLVERATRIVAAAASCTLDEARELLVRCDGEVKTAIVSHSSGVSPDEARARLKSVGGYLRQALGLTLALTGEDKK
ncbi:MAG: N-acetylmuramic acid 6-phosphate etherase [Xanthomonadales bacterium]|nr:N-acetylmuramic acid 6-phosphate etherase [Xanthomonadales bacterium]